MAVPPAAVRMIDIARSAGCSRATVSHVLSGAGAGKIRVSEAKARQIRRIAQRLDFQPNHAALQLKGKHSRILGIISRNWRDAFQLRVFSWLQHFSAAHGYQVLAAQCQSPAELRQAAGNFISRGVDGIVCYSPPWEQPQPGLRAILRRFGHVVSLFGPLDVPDCCCLDLDEAGGVRQAVLHLHQRGRRRIALLLESDSESTRRRREGYLRAHRELGLPCPRGLQYTGASTWVWDIPGVHQRVEQAVGDLVLKRQADALIAHDDYGAAFIYQALDRLGYRPGREVAVVGYQNDLVAHHLTPPLTSIHVPVRETVQRAVETILARIENPDAPRPGDTVIRPELIVRDST